jgi:hypothetical protein
LPKGIAPQARIHILGEYLDKGIYRKSIINFSMSFGFSTENIQVVNNKKYFCKNNRYFQKEIKKCSKKEDYNKYVFKKEPIPDYVHRLLIKKDKKINQEVISDLKDLLLKTDRLFVLAAGNESVTLQHSGYTIASAQAPAYHPALSPYFILVGNYDIATNALAGSSNTPGCFENIFITAPGSWGINYVGKKTLHPLLFNNAGTSTATAMVTGILALLQQAFPEVSNQKLKEALFQGARKDFAGYTPESYGHGIADFRGAYEYLKKCGF